MANIPHFNDTLHTRIVIGCTIVGHLSPASSEHRPLFMQVFGGMKYGTHLRGLWRKVPTIPRRAEDLVNVAMHGGDQSFRARFTLLCRGTH